MAGETVITVVGNLTADPELRPLNNGVMLASFTIASTPRSFDRQTNEWKDGETLFLRATAWRELGEHVANSLRKGTRVIARGNLTQRSYDDKDGQRRTSYELTVDEIGPSLRYATAQVERVQSRGGFDGGQPSGQSGWGQAPASQSQQSSQNDNPWGNPGGSGGNSFGSGFDDEQPF